MKFKCGCEIDPTNFNIRSVPLDCPEVYRLIGEGNTKGIFQLESNLCRHWSKEIKPQSIEDIAAIVSLVRPGCLKAMSGGKSMTQHYADRKNGKEPVEYLCGVAEQALKDTYGVLTYQEQAMEIARLAAGFNLQEADVLRKAIGKKLAAEMAKVKTMFLQKAKECKIVTDEQAVELFDNIEKSQRYSFNRAHAVEYAMLAYWSAYTKAHSPLQFFCSWLAMAKDKQDPQQEKRELINDAKINGIEVCGPDFRRLEPHFFIDGQHVRFGLNDMKGLGKSIFEKLKFVVKDEVEAKIGVSEQWSWYDFLTEVSRKISSIGVKALILSGALSYMGVSRTRMLFEYDKWTQLTESEQSWVISRRPEFSELIQALRKVKFPKKEGGGVARKDRIPKIDDIIKSLENPPFSLEDKADRVAFDEEQLLGVAISFSQIDACDTREANTSCRELLDGVSRDYMIVAVNIDRVREIKTKSGANPGQKMAFLSISDASCPVDDCVVFPDAYLEFGSSIVEGNTVLAQVERDKNRGSVILKKCWSI